ncbi:glycosyltransferase family 2 protein [Magnetococcus sp. PR-3]|uniref:glycosyltransferase family 2 protein n=1 Tax=Magnetococcus sp. PR-3 TaxID=3120355 RepID=UPI002FCE39E5
MNTTHTTPQCCLIVVNYNGGHYLDNCLQSLQQLKGIPFEVIVVDNASQDGSTQHVPVDDARFSLLALEDNVGFARANNLAAQRTQAPWIATINPDTKLPTNWLEEMLKVAHTHPNAGALGSALVAMDNEQLWDGMGDVYSIVGFAWRGGHQRPREQQEHLPLVAETFCSCAAASLYRRELFLTLGGFDESYFCYCEDVDLGFRIRLMGHSVLQVRTTFAYHAGSAISGRTSAFTIYHGTRNTIWTLFKNMPWPLLLISLLPHFMLHGVQWFGDVPKEQKQARLQGIKHGLKGIPQIISRRWHNRHQRRVGSWQMARRLSWSPHALLKRAIVLFPTDRA